MPATISADLRVRIFEARQAGETASEIAERFEVSTAFVRRLMQRYRQTGSLAPSDAPRGPKPKLAEQADQLRQLNAQQPDLTPAEIRQRLGLTVSLLTIWRMLRRLGLTFKKSPSMPPNATVQTCKKPVGSGRSASGSTGRNA
jgi:transposase